MTKQKSSKRLNIYLNGLHLGILEHKEKQNLVFKYHSNWLEREKCFPISRSLPLREDKFEGVSVFTYFDNLLPDSISIRQRIATKMHSKSDSVFDLLSILGRDCVGALQFSNEEDVSPKLENAKGIKVTEEEIADKIKNLNDSPLALTDENNFRLSIAGAQEKTAFLKLKDEWFIPAGNTPTTHIFKPQIGELIPRLIFSNSVENEWLCSQIIREFGLPVCECFISEFQDIKVLIVERFDRIWEKTKLIRIPQEDCCQALSIASFGKYEADGGPGVLKIMDLLYESKRVGEDRRNFLKTQIVFHLLAAIDGHAKNFSIQWGPNGFQMTPLYDVLSAQPIIDQGKFQYDKIKMAMAIGDNRHYKLKEIFQRHFLQTAKQCRFDIQEMNSIIDETISAVPIVIDKVSKKISKGFPTEVAESVFSGMKKRINHFK